MQIDTKIIKKVLYKIDPLAKVDEEFVETINLILYKMEEEQVKHDKKTKQTINHQNYGRISCAFTFVLGWLICIERKTKLERDLEFWKAYARELDENKS